METVVINARNRDDIKLLMDLAKRIGASVKIVDTETIQDQYLALLIEAGLKTPSVARDEVMKVLER